jgi:hypothetical protein
VLDGKGLKGLKSLLKDHYLKNKDFMFTIASFEK